jgi:hypothetical protein
MKRRRQVSGPRPIKYNIMRTLRSWGMPASEATLDKIMVQLHAGKQARVGGYRIKLESGGRRYRFYPAKKGLTT